MCEEVKARDSLTFWSFDHHLESANSAPFLWFGSWHDTKPFFPWPILCQCSLSFENVFVLIWWDAPIRSVCTRLACVDENRRKAGKDVLDGGKRWPYLCSKTRNIFLFLAAPFFFEMMLNSIQVQDFAWFRCWFDYCGMFWVKWNFFVRWAIPIKWCSRRWSDSILRSHRIKSIGPSIVGSTKIAAIDKNKRLPLSVGPCKCPTIYARLGQSEINLLAYS